MVALPNWNPVEGLITDAANALTIFGQLRQLVAQTSLQTTLTATNALQAVAAGGAFALNVTALPAGQRIYGLTAHHSAGGAFRVAVGTAGAVVNDVLLGYDQGQLVVPRDRGYSYGANNRLWMAGVNAGNVIATVYTA